MDITDEDKVVVHQDIVTEIESTKTEITSSVTVEEVVTSRSDRNQKDVKPRQLNPIRQDGNPIRCRCCESICHLVKDCPDSYQNQEKDINFVKTTLFTGNQDTEMQVFFNECLYSCGFRWWV